ncbi:hypothetical protein L2E82_33259 [Cichorium intybus]|uniref:Uncharacterized protein n=1 Tax=Cichorium intybus TaxID=13427 RepID=A0ACB9BJX8_CICIN|nr:hypothetical protein L2E82_33259 [Cichorium intybus]
MCLTMEKHQRNLEEQVIRENIALFVPKIDFTAPGNPCSGIKDIAGNNIIYENQTSSKDMREEEEKLVVVASDESGRQVRRWSGRSVMNDLGLQNKPPKNCSGEG